MSTAAEHYEHHLGPIYVWMAGGAEAALQTGSAEIEALNLPVTCGAVVLDLVQASECMPFHLHAGAHA
jgi:hypothetical protein